MNIKEIKDLIEAVSKAQIDDFYFEDKEVKIEIKNNKPVFTSPAPQAVPVQEQETAAGTQNIPVAQASTQKNGTAAGQEEEGLIPVKSPIVGTFYRSPNPSAPPFIEAGSEVQQSTTVCIVEAMKVMNEIKANCHGKVAKILVEDGQPVEYEQVLMYVSPL